MADGSTTNAAAPEAARMRTLLATFHHVGFPLVQALCEASVAGGKPAAADSGQLGGLVDSAVTLSRELAAQLGASDDQLDAWVRWALAGAASQVVAASFQATGHPLTAEQAHALAGSITELQTRFKAQIPPGGEPVPNTVATFRAKMMEAMVPVIGAVARYSFGRAEHALLAEVAQKLIKTSDQVTRALAPPGATPEEWRLLCWSVLRSAGQIYADSHYAEADRLLYMEPNERAAYYAQHGNIPPMTQVWQSFNQRLAMLATLANYLEVPGAAQLDVEGWR